MTVDLSALYVRDWVVACPVITLDTTIATALRLLHEQGVSALPVWDQGRYVGVAEETQLLRYRPSEATALDVFELREVLDRMIVARVVAPVFPYASVSDTLVKGAKLLLRSPHGTIPVVQDGHPIGLLTWADLLRAAIRTSDDHTSVAATSATDAAG